MTNPLLQLTASGQAIWLDHLHRKIVESGELEGLIEVDGLRGMTSNPSIFEKAIGEGGDYDDRLKAILEQGDLEPGELYEKLAISDIQAAADVFRPLYDRLGGADGYVSLEVSPYLGMDTEGTIAEARRLWRAVDRPNVMIKVPGTKPGVPAIRQLIGEGINVNVTLLFGLDAYQAVADAHMEGLETLKIAGGDVQRVHGVASFFVSRIDTQIDKEIDRRVKAGDAQAEALKALRGKVAIANAKIAYQLYLDMLKGERWQALAEAGAAPQRLLWASTGTKDPAFSDVLYVETLIGPDTINTMPVKTLDAFRDHGKVAPTLTADIDEARRVLAETQRLGLDLQGVTDGLVKDGVRLFADAFDELLGAVAAKRTQVLGARLNPQSVKLPSGLQSQVDEGLEKARAEGWSRRLWAGDASLWTGADEARWLGWLDAGKGGAVDLEALEALQAQVKAGGFAHALLLGMGGSSLGPEVLAQTFGSRPGFPELLVLDSTDPAQVRRTERKIDPKSTLFIVSSKSGSTLEPDILHRYFFDVAGKALGGEAEAGARFIAVTDPGSKLEQTAKDQNFLRIFPGVPQIGGRYSVLSNFGLVPAAVMGLDLRDFMDRTRTMVRACAASAPPASNPGVHLGVVLGVAAKAGVDKVSILASKGVADLGAWLEQLIAESTGKQGKGIIPIDAEPLAAAEHYSRDRLIAYLRLEDHDEPHLDALVRQLEDLGHPVVRIAMAGRESLGQEFFRWEVATAIAGAVMELHPFDQPDVEASKIKTRALTDAYEKSGALPGEEPVVRSNGLALYADARNADALAQAAGSSTLEAWLDAHFRRAHDGDYVGLLAYLDRSRAHVEALQKVRARIRDRRGVATALGFGPRFLHSTGQGYKGGPNSGVFLQITAAPAADVAVPGRSFSFGVVEQAQARGDLEVLAERGRRVLRLDLGHDVEQGLKTLAEVVERSLG
jgi:transaldolase/glucose-6-phosphate isomerase